MVLSLLREKRQGSTLQKQTKEQNLSLSAPYNKKLTQLTQIGPLYRAATIIVSDTNHKRVAISVDCELEFKELHFELDAKQKELRQKISDTLHFVPLNLLYTIDGKRALQKRLKENLNAMLVDGKIVHVYLTIEGNR